MSARPRVVVTHWVHDEILALLQEAADVVANRSLDSWSREELHDAAGDAVGLLVFMPDLVDGALLSRCPQLRIVAGALKGWDNIDVRACAERNVYVTVVPDLLTAPTADLAIALLLSVTRRVLPGDHHIREGWFHGWRPVFLGEGVEGSTVGIVGFGALGQAIARRLSGFGARVLFADPLVTHATGFGPVEPQPSTIEDLLAASDHVILATPLTAGSFHLINQDTLRRMKRGSTLVNVGRGSVIDESEVALALASGHLGRYAADVFEFEDLSRRDRPRGVPPALLDMGDRTVFTPHLGSAVAETRLRIARAAALSILDVLDGRTPRNAVNAPTASLAGNVVSA